MKRVGYLFDKVVEPDNLPRKPLLGRDRLVSLRISQKVPQEGAIMGWLKRNDRRHSITNKMIIAL